MSTNMSDKCSTEAVYSYDYVGKGVDRKEPIFVKDDDE